MIVFIIGPLLNNTPKVVTSQGWTEKSIHFCWQPEAQGGSASKRSRETVLPRLALESYLHVRRCRYCKGTETHLWRRTQGRKLTWLPVCCLCRRVLESVQDLALALAPFIWTLLFLPVLLGVVSVHPGFLSHSSKCRGAAGASQSWPRSSFWHCWMKIRVSLIHFETMWMNKLN